MDSWRLTELPINIDLETVGGKETNRNAVYEALLSNIELKDSISNSEMKSRIKNDKSQLTSKVKVYDFPEQLLLKLEEKTVANNV